MTVPVIAIVGCANAGKTTLIEQLVGMLTQHGLRVGTIKHSHHQPELDKPGKDSWRHKQAGAAASLLVGPEQLQLIQDLHEAMTPRQLAERYFPDVDLVLVEGYSSMPGDKIEVVRAGCSTQLRCRPEHLLAVVTDLPQRHAALPQFALDDVDALSAWIMRRIGRD